MRSLSALLLVVPLVAAACGGPAARTDVRSPLADRLVELPGLRYAEPARWRALGGDGAMRIGQYEVPGAGGDDAEAIIYYFGPTGAGSVEANIERWCNQLEQPDGSSTRESADVRIISIDEMTVHTVDARGVYVAETFPGSGERVNRPDHRLLAAIVQTPAGPYYVKLIGPLTTVSAAAPELDAMIESMEARSP